MLALGLFLASAFPVAAQGMYPDGAVGLDLSFPQCGESVPTSDPASAPADAFGIVGVNEGKAYTYNPCLVSQVQALASQGMPVSFYLNLNAPNPARGQDPSGPNGECDPQTEVCTDYDYGWNAARDAFQYARQQLQSAGVDTLPTSWWLDLETSNYWFADPSRNDQVIQGAIDFLQETGRVANPDGDPSLVVGIYSRRSMWRQIAGPTYQPGVPTWAAGADSLDTATLFCDPVSFSGGPVWLVQLQGQGLDVDYACP